MSLNIDVVMLCHSSKFLKPSNELLCNIKTNDQGFASSEDSDQPEDLPNLIIVITVCMRKAKALDYPSNTQQRLIRLGRY